MGIPSKHLLKPPRLLATFSWLGFDEFQMFSLPDAAGEKRKQTEGLGNAMKRNKLLEIKMMRQTEDKKCILASIFSWCSL